MKSTTQSVVLVGRRVGRTVKPVIVVAALLLAVTSLAATQAALAGDWHHKCRKWIASWTTSMQGVFVYSPSIGCPPPGGIDIRAFRAAPELIFAFPNADTDGAVDQTFRLIVKPDLWAKKIRLRFSNFFGNRPLTLSSVTVGLQEYAANVVAGTITTVTFEGGHTGVSIEPGERVFSDPVHLDFVKHRNIPLLAGRNLAVSFAVQGQSGPMTFHSAAFGTSYISAPGSGDHTADDADAAFPYSTTSWFFLDAVDVRASCDTVVVCAFGDSITDGTFSTLNGNDRWANALSRRLHDYYGDKISVVNAGIGGNTVVTPGSSPTAVDRLDRDVLGVSGLTAVVWLEGINDLGSGQNTPPPIIDGYKNVVARLHAAEIKVIGATLTSSFVPDQDYSTSPLGTAFGPLYGSPQTDAYRRVLNDFIRNSDIYDGVADMDAVTLDPETDALKSEFVPNTTIGGPGDYLHPNRAGYAAMGEEAERALRVLFDDFDDKDDNDKVTLCHKGKETILVGAAAVPAHLKHGDTLGPCPD